MNKGNCAFLKTFTFCIFGTLFAGTASAQINWNVTDPGKDIFSGIPLACCDLNGDSEDDLVVLDQTKHLWIGLQIGNGSFLWKATNYHQFSALWSINIADLDKNGFSDILLSGESTKLQIMYQFKDGFQLQIADDNSFFSQAACVYDINMDGWLDFTLCDDNHATRIYLNDGTGKLKRDTALVPLSFPNPMNEAGNYGCIWTDIENDGDPDLYISKCRPGVVDPTDPRRVNLLFINENGVWKEEGRNYGLDLGDQSWMTLFEDFDGDGLKDCFVVNHYSASRMFHQLPNHKFEDLTATCGIDFPGICIQAIPADFDNDGDLDILMTGNACSLWINEGSMKFTEQKGALASSGLSSCAVGDLNGDGFIDIYGSYADLLNAPNNQKDKVWFNTGNPNHFIAFSLKGRQSNIHGIGSRIELYANGHYQSRELHGGEAFGIQNSLNIHFGLGNASTVDSIVIHWTSGQTDRFYNLSSGLKYLLEEESCATVVQRQSGGLIRNFCNSIDTTLRVAAGARNWVWNDGSKRDTLRVQSEGIYFYRETDSLGCPTISQPVAILFNPKVSYRLNHSYHQILCEGDYLDLAVNGSRQIHWSTGQTDSLLRVDKSGLYYGQIKAYCDWIFTDTLNLEVFQLPDPPLVEPDTLTGRGKASLTSKLDSTYWFNYKEDEIPLFVGKHFVSDTVETPRSFWAESRSSHKFPFVHGGMKQPDYSGGPYHAKFLNNLTLFNVYQNVFLDSVTVYTDDPGLRTIELLDHTGVRLAHKDADLHAGKNQLYLGFEIPASENVYFLGTNLESNQKLFGENSPRLYRSDRGFYYPFFIEDKVRILSSDKGDNYYYYFFDWVIRAADEVCKSPRQEVRVEIIPVDTKESEVSEEFWIQQYQNGLRVHSDEQAPMHISIKNEEGKIVMNKNIMPEEWLDVQNFHPGLYFIEIKTRSLPSKHIKFCKY